MEKLKEYRYIVLIALIILGFAFYWYEYRPTKIKERCSSDAHFNPRNIGQQALINNEYEDCLMRFGLK